MRKNKYIETVKPPSILRRMDPLLDPVILYLIVAGPLKVILYFVVATINPDSLIVPVIGPIWYGLDENVIVVLLSYSLSAAFLLILRDNSRGQRMISRSTAKSARYLTRAVLLLALSSIIERYIVETGYIAVIFLPVFLGWLGISVGRIHAYKIVLVCLFAYAATQSKWALVSLLLTFSISSLALPALALLILYPYLNQLRFFLVALQLGYSAEGGLSLLSIPDLSILNSLVAIFSRFISFESNYLLQTAGVSSFTDKSLSFYNLTQYVSADVLGLNYGLSVSFYSQMTFVFGSPSIAGVMILLICVFYGAISRIVMRFTPSLALVLGMYATLTLSDGFILNRQKYLLVGLVVFLLVHVFSRCRLRFTPADAQP